MVVSKIYALLFFVFLYMNCKTAQPFNLKQLKESNTGTGILEINFIASDGFKLPSILLNATADEQPIKEEDTLGSVVSISTPMLIPFPKRKEPYPQLTENLSFSISGNVLQSKNRFTVPIGNYYATLDNYHNHTKISFGKTVFFDIHGLFGYTLTDDIEQTVAYNGSDCARVIVDESFFENSKLQFTKRKIACPKIMILPNKTTILNFKISEERFRFGPTILRWTLLPFAYFGLDSTIYVRDIDVELVNPTEDKIPVKGSKQK